MRSRLSIQTEISASPSSPAGGSGRTRRITVEASSASRCDRARRRAARRGAGARRAASAPARSGRAPGSAATTSSTPNGSQLPWRQRELCSRIQPRWPGSRRNVASGSETVCSTRPLARRVPWNAAARRLEVERALVVALRRLGPQAEARRGRGGGGLDAAEGRARAHPSFIGSDRGEVEPGRSRPDSGRSLDTVRTPFHCQRRDATLWQVVVAPRREAALRSLRTTRSGTHRTALAGACAGPPDIMRTVSRILEGNCMPEVGWRLGPTAQRRSGSRPRARSAPRARGRAAAVRARDRRPARPLEPDHRLARGQRPDRAADPRRPARARGHGRRPPLGRAARPRRPAARLGRRRHRGAAPAHDRVERAAPRRASRSSTTPSRSAPRSGRRCSRR